MNLIEVIHHEDDNTYGFCINGVTRYDGVLSEKAMHRLSTIVDNFDCWGEDYNIVFKWY